MITDAMIEALLGDLPTLVEGDRVLSDAECRQYAVHAIESVLAAMWQPIETAPRDGTWIMLWRNAAKIGTWMPVVIARWDSEEEAFSWPDDIYDPYHDLDGANRMIDEGRCFSDLRNFTHWAPMLDKPQQPK